MDYNQQFNKWVESLQDYERRYFFNRIAAICDVKYVTVQNWRYGRRKIKRPVAITINQAVGQDVIKLD